jgi:hypothetical protein
MTHERPAPPSVLTRPALRTPGAAAVAGIVFAVLLLTALVLVRVSVPAQIDDRGMWLTEGGRRRLVAAALWLVPFAGIAFLWFIGVVRDRVGAHEDRFFATVFLGSGLLFVAMLFTASAMAAGLLASFGPARTPAAAGPAWELGRAVTFTVLTVYAMKMAAVFMLSTTTIIWRTTSAPRWLTAGGYLAAVLLLLGSGALPWLELVFPIWVLVLSVHILVVSKQRHSAGARGP